MLEVMNWIGQDTNHFVGTLFFLVLVIWALKGAF